MDGLIFIYGKAFENQILRLVLIAIAFDTVFGVLRAIKEKKFNSNCGINGAIRKVGMIISMLALVAVDHIVKLNLIGFIPEKIRDYLPADNVGIMEFFGILFIAYEIVSILKNMTLCGLPVKKLWQFVKTALGRYTDELPDEDELAVVQEQGPEEETEHSENEETA